VVNTYRRGWRKAAERAHAACERAQREVANRIAYNNAFFVMLVMPLRDWSGLCETSARPLSGIGKWTFNRGSLLKSVAGRGSSRRWTTVSPTYHPAAVVRAAIEAEINGQPRSLRLVFLNAWTKTPKGWKFIAWQSTPQPTS
jgi:hypothetical protein